jgi:hypothetical protein
MIKKIQMKIDLSIDENDVDGFYAAICWLAHNRGVKVLDGDNSPYTEDMSEFYEDGDLGPGGPLIHYGVWYKFDFYKVEGKDCLYDSFEKANDFLRSCIGMEESLEVVLVVNGQIIGKTDG